MDVFHLHLKGELTMNDNIIASFDFFKDFNLDPDAIAKRLAKDYQNSITFPSSVAEIIIERGKNHIDSDMQNGWAAFVHGYFIGRSDQEDDEECFLNEEDAEAWLRGEFE